MIESSNHLNTILRKKCAQIQSFIDIGAQLGQMKIDTLPKKMFKPFGWGILTPSSLTLRRACARKVWKGSKKFERILKKQVMALLLCVESVKNMFKLNIAMKNDKGMFYADQHGFASNVHPINSLLNEEAKVLFLCEFEIIMQSVRNNHENVASSFHKIINLVNSPN